MADVPENITSAYVAEQFNIDEELMDDYENAIASSADRYKRSVKDAIRGALDDLLTDENGLVKNDPRNINILEDVGRQANELMEDAGMGSLEGDIMATYDKRLSTMNELVKNVGLTQATIEDFNQLPAINDRITSVSQRIANGNDVIANEVRGEMFRFRNNLEAGNRVRFGRLVDTLETKAGILPNYSKTVARTELMGIDRTARNLQADRAGIDRFKYMGVRDSKTRPFCRAHLGDIETREVWRNMQNNTGPQPVLTYCGGYNCRHRLMMWKKEWGE